MLNSLIESKGSKFVTRNCNLVNDQSNAKYSAGNEITYSIPVLKFHLCH